MFRDSRAHLICGSPRASSGRSINGGLEVSSVCPTANDAAVIDLDHCRSILFASFVASGFVPMIHACVLDGTDVLGFFPLAHAIGMVTCYLTGTLFYLSRFPERRYPIKYDIWVRTTHISMF